MTPLEAETMVAGLGLDRILAGTPSLTAEAQTDAVSFPKRARALILRALGNPEPDDDAEAEETDPVDYDEATKLLEADEDETKRRAEALYDALPDDIQDDVEAAATYAIAYLQRELPKRLTKTTARLGVSPPEPYELNRFERKWMIVIDPMSALRAMAEGSLDMVMVDALAEAYPEIYKLIAGEGGLLDDAIATMKARRGEKWDVTDDQDRQVKILIQQDPIDFDLANDFAALAPPTPAPPGKHSSRDIKPTDELLPSQKSA